MNALGDPLGSSVVTLLIPRIYYSTGSAYSLIYYHSRLYWCIKYLFNNEWAHHLCFPCLNINLPLVIFWKWGSLKKRSNVSNLFGITYVLQPNASWGCQEFKIKSIISGCSHACLPHELWAKQGSSREVALWNKIAPISITCVWFPYAYFFLLSLICRGSCKLSNQASEQKRFFVSGTPVCALVKVILQWNPHGHEHLLADDPQNITVTSYAKLTSTLTYLFLIGKAPNKTIQSKEVRHGADWGFLLNFTKHVCTLSNAANPFPELLLAIKGKYVYPKELKGCINVHSWKGRKRLRFLSAKSLKLSVGQGGNSKKYLLIWSLFFHCGWAVDLISPVSSATVTSLHDMV